MLKNIQEITLRLPGQVRLISLGGLHFSERKWRISEFQGGERRVREGGEGGKTMVSNVGDKNFKKSPWSQVKNQTVVERQLQFRVVYVQTEEVDTGGRVFRVRPDLVKSQGGLPGGREI